MMELTIGITGGIGSGKSVVSRILRCNGFTVYDCDSEAKYLMVNDPFVKKSLQDKLGDNIYLKDGNLNKAELSGLVFNNKDVREFVNGIVHSAVKKDIIKERERIKGDFFIESAIPVTGGLESLCQQIWLVSAPEDERIKRVKKRDEISTEEIKKRIKSQENEFKDLPEDKLVKIQNDGFHLLLPHIMKLTDKFKLNQIYDISC